MRKIKSFINSQDGELVLGTIVICLFYWAFYKSMWIASAIGLLN